jgi:hypothetical protein
MHLKHWGLPHLQEIHHITLLYLPSTTLLHFKISNFITTNGPFLLKKFNTIFERKLASLFTQYDGHFCMRFGKRITGSLLGMDDYSAINSRTCPVTMRVPPQSSFLGGKFYFLSKLLSRSDWTLCNIFRTIRPWISWLLHSMPAKLLLLLLFKFVTKEKSKFNKIHVINILTVITSEW